MAAVALDLTPVVDALLAQPFDRPTLDRARAAVGGHPKAFATALRCAAKRAPDASAAAYWFIEAARVHESVDDLGGCIALLARALEMDPGNPHATDLLCGNMTRLAMRTGLDFTFRAKERPAAADASTERRSESRPPPVESGLRPPAQTAGSRDTLPDLFGMDRPDAEVDFDALLEKPDPDAEPEAAAAPASRRVAPMLPPRLADASLGSDVPRSRAGDELGLLAIADLATQTRRSSDVSPRRAALHVVPKPAPMVTAETMPAPASPPVPSSPQPDDAYGELRGPRTERPRDDRLMGALFEALHDLHFSADVREGAAFVQRVLREKMRAGTILVHVHDINSRHFVVMSAHGSRAAALVDYATPEDDAFVAEIMKSDGAALFAASDPRLARGRWLLVEPRRSVLCAPAVVDGRYLGLIELADPEDGTELGEDDRNALTYVANAFARFLAQRGIVLSEDPAGVSLTPE
jgi:hypothetical protein